MANLYHWRCHYDNHEIVKPLEIRQQMSHLRASDDFNFLLEAREASSNHAKAAFELRQNCLVLTVVACKLYRCAA
jgi:hypothetical protein